MAARASFVRAELDRSSFEATVLPHANFSGPLSRVHCALPPPHPRHRPLHTASAWGGSLPSQVPLTPPGRGDAASGPRAAVNGVSSRLKAVHRTSRLEICAASMFGR